METTIYLPYGAQGEGFKVSDLVKYLNDNFRDYIIQGQVNCTLANHPKPKSLDFWIRTNYTSKKDTKQATNDVIQEIIETGLFKIGKFPCPDSGRSCKGIKLVKVILNLIQQHKPVGIKVNVVVTKFVGEYA